MSKALEQLQGVVQPVYAGKPVSFIIPYWLTVDEMSTIFGLFVQVDDSLARPQGGLGVRLPDSGG